MQQIKIFSDRRLEDHCTYCGDTPSTKDHVPSKVLLDSPFPDNFPVVPACSKCNNGFSLDEEYFACLLECAICGTTEISKLQRSKVKDLLEQNKSLHYRLMQAKTIFDGQIFFKPELNRVHNVALKHARGIVKYEFSECPIEDPVFLNVKPMPNMTLEGLDQFYSMAPQAIFPEIGSRAFKKLEIRGDQIFNSWTIVQEGAFRYSTCLSQGIKVKFVIREYLMCEAQWE
jgi:hypothetical protein